MAHKSCEAMNVHFLINTKTRRVIHAEAGKEFVDYLFSFLSMPIGYVLKLVDESKSNRKIGSVSNLYDSMEKLPSQFMSTDKSQLLDPKFITTYSNKSLKIEGGKYYACSYPNTTHSTPAFVACSPALGTCSSSFASNPAFASSTTAFGPTDIFKSVSNFGYTSPAFGASSTPAFGPTDIFKSVSNFSYTSPAFGASSTPAFGATSFRSVSQSANVPREVSTSTIHNMSTSNKDICICGNPINRQLELLQNSNSSGSSSQNAGQGQSGYVKEVATFIITDDLKITGSSTSAIMTVLNQLNVNDLTELEERTTIADRNKALKLLEASLVSTTVLSDVFGAEFFLPAKASSS